MLIDVDIPVLSSVSFGSNSFQYTYSLQSSSTNTLFSLSFDATVLGAYIMSTSQYVPYDPSKLADASTDLNIPNGYFSANSITSFNMTNNGDLKRIVIGNSCFGNVRVFELDGLSELESVVIGQSSFRIGGNERSDGDYRIVNCPKLASIQIGDFSFNDYYSFELNNLPSLQSAVIGRTAFSWAPSFLLAGMIGWLE